MDSHRRCFILGLVSCALAFGGDANDTGRFLAGLPGEQGSPYAELESGDAWQLHRKQLDAAWRNADVKLLSELRDFQKSELNVAAIQKSTVFYPFGGPDALTAITCFPRNSTYVMVGLEPAGTLPSAEQIKKKDLTTYLAEIRGTMASELGRSFFITRQMDRQFRGQVTDGLALPILQLLVRTQNTVLGFRYVRIDEQGRVVDRVLGEESPGKFRNRGIEIQFRSEADQATHKLFYFAVNLSDVKLKQNQAFMAYVATLKGSVTLLKATSYMTHRPDFSIIRNQVLANSSAILQDDSGIPYHYFQQDQWKTQLYGDYNRPYGSFRWLEQADLRSAYKTAGTKPLSLHIGYGFSRIASNLLLAHRVEGHKL